VSDTSRVHVAPVHDARMYDVYLGLGSNQGDRLNYLNRAREHIRSLDGTVVVATSPAYESRAHVKPGQIDAPDFLNAVIHIRTTLGPSGLLAACEDIERELGRIRSGERWLPRTIDIDILLIDGMSRWEDHLTVPHPRMHERRFVLQPLCDIDPVLHVPVPFDKSVKNLLTSCSDSVPVSLYADFVSGAQAWSRSGRTADSQ